MYNRPHRPSPPFYYLVAISAGLKDDLDAAGIMWQSTTTTSPTGKLMQRSRSGSLHLPGSPLAKSISSPKSNGGSPTATNKSGKTVGRSLSTSSNYSNYGSEMPILENVNVIDSTTYPSGSASASGIGTGKRKLDSS